jgi:hypothetical protein
MLMSAARFSINLPLQFSNNPKSLAFTVILALSSVDLSV